MARQVHDPPGGPCAAGGTHSAPEFLLERERSTWLHHAPGDAGGYFWARALLSPRLALLGSRVRPAHAGPLSSMGPMTAAEDTRGVPRQPRVLESPSPGPAAYTDRSAVPSRRCYLALWCALLLVSAAVVVSPDIPVAVPNPPLSVGLSTLAGAVGLALLQLGLLRFDAFGRPLDLFAGLAFGTLGLANLVVRVLGPAVGFYPGQSETSFAFVLFARTLAAGLFVAALVRLDEVVVAGQRRRFALFVGGGVAAGLGVGAAGIVAMRDRFPRAVDARAGELLDANARIPDVLTGQEAWVVLADGAGAVLLLLAALGYLLASRRLADSHIASLAVALSLLSVSQFHALLFPPLDPDYVSTSDAFRLAAYVGLLTSLVQRLGREFAECASQQERLRLSRELHDGLAQQLILLHLRLQQAVSPGRLPEAHARDLLAAQRLVEAALLETRQAITVLRAGAVSWQEFQWALATMTDEFARNHDVDVQVTAQGQTSALDAELQLDILRLVHEALSNAVRHGAAKRLEVALVTAPQQLEVTIRDNGGGFELADVLASQGGVGLNSMIERLQRRAGRLSIDSSPGQGTCVHAWLPVRDSREVRP
jgi:signal transduction histidine kinase